MINKEKIERGNYILAFYSDNSIRLGIVVTNSKILWIKDQNINYSVSGTYYDLHIVLKDPTLKRIIIFDNNDYRTLPYQKDINGSLLYVYNNFSYNL